MCTNPITMFSKALGREITAGCRTCDACVAVRRHNWVARAMAEKAMHPQTFVVALTYSDATQFTRDGARFFRYQDVRLFLARLRDAIKQATGQVAALRFLAAGEQGSRNGRCHWHVVLYSDVDLLTIGEFSAPWGRVTEASDIIAPMGQDMPRNWTMWPHGFVQVQVPDAGGMHYALSYALKDQFNAMKSAGSKRVSKSEAFATGLFRMSKSPPIGVPWMEAQIYDLYLRGQVLPNTKLQVPDLSGYWYPSGVCRKVLLEGLRRVNHSFAVQHGRNAPQWSSLIYECRDNDSDLEALGYLPTGDEDEETSVETEIARRAKETAGEAATRAIRQKCGSGLPCLECLRGLPDKALADLGLYWEGPEILDRATQKTPIRKTQGGINPYCGLAATKSRQRAFPQSASEAFDPVARCAKRGP